MLSVQLAEKMKYFDQGIFNALEDKKAKVEASGKHVIDLSVGTPDLPPDPGIMEELAKACQNPKNLQYSLGDTPELVEAVQGWYQRRYDVPLEKEQITSVYGSQEGLAHIAFPLCNPGDVAIVPTPSYPIFRFGPLLAGAQIYEAPMLEENGYLLDLDAIPEEVARRARLIVVSYPNNPVTATATPQFYARLVEWAKEYNTAVVSDAAYSELVLDGPRAGSFLATSGAMDVGVEFNSLSKSYNLTGIRIAFCVGNPEIMKAFKQIRSQIDYGISFPVQYAAAAALNGPQDIIVNNQIEYRHRRDVLCGGLNLIGWPVAYSKATMFVWARIPKGAKDSTSFVTDLLEKAGVLVVPGAAFGKAGEGYVRIALVQPGDVLQQAVDRIAKSGILEEGGK